MPELPFPNPASNQLGQGVTLEKLLGAIRQSGYPLQAVVKATINAVLQSQLTIKEHLLQDEWSYIDDETGIQHQRTIDLYDCWYFRDRLRGRQRRVEPVFVLLIECKQSDLPYVFFSTRNVVRIDTLPRIAGLRSDHIRLATNGTNDTIATPLSEALSFASHRYLQAPPVAFSFSRVSRNRDRLEVTGSEAYQGIILPLLKACDFYVQFNQPKSTYTYFEMHLTIPLCVVDAPMIMVKTSPEGNLSAEYSPWVRILRNRPETLRIMNNQLYAVDIVHKDFLTSYLTDYLVPFSYSTTQAVLKHQEEIHSGEGFVRDYFTSVNDIENRLQPR